MTELLSSADMALARRIEAGHAHSATVSTQGISVEAMTGGWAIYHQVDSPVTQAISIGMNGTVAPGDLDRLEAFFHDRGSAAVIDHCTLADPNLPAMFQERGYVVREISNVMARRLDSTEKRAASDIGLTVEPVQTDEFRFWSRMVMRGFAGHDDIPEQQVEMLATANPQLHAFFGLRNSSRVATAAFAVHAGLATFYGDATLVDARGHGLQLALIRSRLQKAAELGCDLATASVVPGGTSHRNYERAGFQLVYGRVMVRRSVPG